MESNHPLTAPCVCGHSMGQHLASHLGGCMVCACIAFDEALPLFPYAGTSGHSGSETSMERAVRDDESGVTEDRQRATLNALARRGEAGITWKELGDAKGWHHGQASGVLSVLHKEGRVARVAERRDRCEVYVLPDKVEGRITKAHGRKRPTLDDDERDLLTKFERAIEQARGRGFDTRVTIPFEAAESLARALRRLS